MMALVLAGCVSKMSFSAGDIVSRARND
jgi:hypothetical protein